MWFPMATSHTQGRRVASYAAVPGATWNLKSEESVRGECVCSIDCSFVRSPAY